jgi:hypothetical protein
VSSAIDEHHVPYVVALTGGRREVVQPFDLLGLGDEFRQGADGVLDGGLRIDAVLVVQINVIGAEPLQ